MSHNYKFSYVINLININKAKKSLYFDILLTKQTFSYTKIFNSLNYIFRYEIITKNKKTMIRLFINYFNFKNTGNNFKLVSKPSHSFHISLKALTLLIKKTNNSVFLISNPHGILSHNEAVKRKTGGLLLCFFSI